MDEGNMINIAGKVGVGELISVLNGAEVVVGNDSGPVHLSAALGVPTVSIFGSTSPEWTAPRGKRSKVVASEIKCSPCFKRECPIYDYAKCYDDISVERVFKAVYQVQKGDEFVQAST
jgi:heptosyltransferase-2